MYPGGTWLPGLSLFLLGKHYSDLVGEMRH